MFLYGKLAADAVAAMSYLAEEPARRAGSAEIARVRRISKPLAAKVLTRLAAAGWVEGTPGPGGGYRLAKAPSRIRLIRIVELFEQTRTPSVCPFGRHWCGHRDPCPLHDAITDLQDRNRRFLEETTLAVFARGPVPTRRPGARAAAPGGGR